VVAATENSGMNGPRSITPEELQKILEETFSQKYDLVEDIRALNGNSSICMLRVKCKDKYFGQRIEISLRDAKFLQNRTDQSVIDYIKKYKSLKPIYYVVKTFLYNMGLSGSSSGLSSYSIILMIVALF
jgi:hypothetical protein